MVDEWKIETELGLADAALSYIIVVTALFHAVLIIVADDTEK